MKHIAAISLLLAVALPFAAPVEGGTRPQPRELNPYDRRVVERLRTRAAARLEQAECGKVLTDFTDRGGRTLESNLRPRGMSPSEYLRQISFVDGSLLATCRNAAVMMAANPGVPRVFVCPAGGGQVTSRLSRIEFQSGSLAEAMVIHEMLHTLGLGENPPTSSEITRRVLLSCFE